MHYYIYYICPRKKQAPKSTNKYGEEKKENCKKEGGKLKMEGRKVRKWGFLLLLLLFFSFFFFFFFFWLLFTFQNDQNLFWVYQNGNFLPEKAFHAREKNQEKWLCPLRKNFLLRPCCNIKTCFKQSFLAYVSNCLIIYLSLAKDRNDFHKVVFMMTSNRILDSGLFL